MKTFLFTYVLIIFSSQLLLSQYNYDNFRFPDVTVKGLSGSFSAAGLATKYDWPSYRSDSDFKAEITGIGFQFHNTAAKQNT